MGEETLLDKIRGFYWGRMIRVMNYVLNNYGYDFGPYFMEELEKMYQKHKNEIDRTN